MTFLRIGYKCVFTRAATFKNSGVNVSILLALVIHLCKIWYFIVLHKNEKFQIGLELFYISLLSQMFF